MNDPRPIAQDGTAAPTSGHVPPTITLDLTGKSVWTPDSTAELVGLGAAPRVKRFGPLRRVLTQFRWELLIIAGLAVYGMGVYGYSEWLASLHEQDPATFAAPNWGDRLFNGAALFVLGAAQGTGMPVVLEIARLLAPVVVGSAAVITLYSLFRARLQLLWIPRMRGHVVVCGLGQVGTEFLRHLRKKGIRVVVVEPNPANPNMELCRSLRTPVIVGDARKLETLRRAGVERAGRLLAVGPSDAINAEIVAGAEELAAGRKLRPGRAAASTAQGRQQRWPVFVDRPPWRRGTTLARRSDTALRCVARISDPDLCVLLRIQADNLAHDARASSLEFFNLDDISARAWLEEYGVTEHDREPHILIGRLDGLGSSLVTLAAARWCADRTDDTQLWITVVDDDAKRRTDALCVRYPGVESLCHFVHCSTSVGELRGLAKDHQQMGAPKVMYAYVTADTDEQALETALGLHQHFDPTVPLMVEMWQTSGVGKLITAPQTSERTNIALFPSLKAACTPELAEGESFEYFEPMAIAIHEQWHRVQTPGRPAPKWDDLDESLKESNRAQARDIPMKVRAIGCAIARIGPTTEPEFVFTDDEVELLARAEHKRWIRERIEAGWEHVETETDEQRAANRAAKKSPDLISFDALPPGIADYDRNAVRAIPAVLECSGQRIVRTQTTECGASAVPGQ